VDGDGNVMGCNANCQIIDHWNCSISFEDPDNMTMCEPYCGNQVLEAEEVCDIGNGIV
jgi:hypothetical protein